MAARFPITPRRKEQLTTAIVAVIFVGLSLANGSYSSELRAVIAIFSWTALIAGTAFGLFPRERPPLAALLTGAFLAGLAVLSGLSVVWASDHGAALREAIRVAAYAGVFGLVVCVTRRAGARPWLSGLAIGIMGVVLLALLSRLIPGLPGGDEEIARLLPAAQGRLSYPIGYWNALAAICALGVVLLTWFSVAARSLALRSLSVAGIPLLGLAIYLTSSRGGVFAAAVGLAALIALDNRRLPLLGGLVLGGIGTGLVVVLARREPALIEGAVNANARTQGAEMMGAIVAVTFAIGAVTLMLDGIRNRAAMPRADASWIRVSPRVARRIGLVAIGLLAVAAIAVINPSKRFDEFKKVPTAEGAGQTDFIATHLASGTGSGRWQFWGVAVDAFQAQPVHGIGAGGYADFWNQHAPISRVTGDAHSIYVEQLGELGLLGLLLVLGVILIGPVWSLARGNRNMIVGPQRAAAVAVVAAGAASAAVDWTWEVPVAFGPVLVALALLAGPALGPEEGDQADAPGQRSLRPWGVATVAVGVVAILLAAAIFLSDREVASSQGAAGDGDLAAAEKDARSAIALEPWASQPRLQLALVQEVAGNLDAAAASAAEASDRAADDWKIWLVRARIATRQGELPTAIADLADARRLNPRAPLFSSLRGPLTSSGPPGGRLAAIEAALLLHPERLSEYLRRHPLGEALRKEAARQAAGRNAGP
jgi:O-antigen ligase